MFQSFDLDAPETANTLFSPNPQATTLRAKVKLDVFLLGVPLALAFLPLSKSLHMNQKREAVILLAEDRNDDILLVKEAFDRAGITNPLLTVRDGDETIAYLQGAGPFADRDHFPFPDLLLLDLKMPRRDGFEILQWIRAHPVFKPLRTVILTSSNDTRDINRAYHLGANSFLVKPMDFEDYTSLSRTVAGFWLERSEAPTFPPEDVVES